jgi:UDP-glucose 4-epimerase
MNILVTGGAGYIGKVFINKFHKNFENIFVIDNLFDSHNTNFPDNVIFYESDFGDKNILSKIFKNRIDCVFHFAAYARIGESNSNPSPFFNNNVLQMIILLDQMNENNCKKIIFSSSASVFGDPTSIPVTEKNEKNPISSYGETKLMGEKLLEWYYSAYNIHSISLRYFNAAGAYGNIGEDRKEETHILPLIFKSIKNNSIFNIFGNDYNTKDGTCIRDYIHVEDLVDAHMLAFSKLEEIQFDFFNLGSEKGVSNLELVETVFNLLNKKQNYKFKPRRSGDPDELIASSEKAKKLLGWKKKYSIEDIVQSLIDYYND